MKVEITNINTGEQVGIYPIAVEMDEIYQLAVTNGGLFEKVWQLVVDAGLVSVEKQDDYRFALVDDSQASFVMNHQVNRKVSDEIFDAHKHSIRNKDEILNSDVCGCFGCLAIMKPAEITHFTEEKERDGIVLSTAWCPYCLIDTVIGAGSGYPITREFLKEMNNFWCGGRAE